MKRTLLALLAVTGLAVSAARADHVDFRANVNVGNYGRSYDRDGYWRDVAVNVWVPGHWETHHNRWGRRVSVWEPGHYEVRTQRVWVSARSGHNNHWNGYRR